MRTPTLLVAAAALLLAGCATSITTVAESDRPGPLPESLLAFTEAGIGNTDGTATSPVEWIVRAGTLASEFGCSVAYEVHEPAGARRSDPLVVIAHGFMRDLSAMRGWAESWAGRGYRSVVVSFCNSTWLNGRHDRNAVDLIAVANELAPGAPVVYAGFSAGGLAALLAAADDTRAAGYLGLDAVDSGDLAAELEPLGVPALYLFGDPSSCNAQNNMLPVLPAGEGTIVMTIPFATHCDFESPYDEGCERICGAVEPADAAGETRRTIGSLSTAWVAELVAQYESTSSTAPAALGSSSSIFTQESLGELERLRRVSQVSLE